jgi:hypothetical protein
VTEFINLRLCSSGSGAVIHNKRLRIRLLFSYIEIRVQPAGRPGVRLHGPLQEMRREYPGSGGHDAGFLDCRQMSVVWRDQALSPVRNLSRQAVLQTRRQESAPGGAVMGEMRRAIAREQAAWSQNMQDEKRMKSTLVIAAAIIAAVRLARDPDISRPSPRLTAVVNESVSLARMILDRVGR